MRTASLATLRGWPWIGALTALFCLIFGLPNFVFLLNYLPSVMDTQAAAIWLGAGFAASCAVLLGVLQFWLSRTNQTWRDLGWGKPTTAPAIVVAVLLAVVWLGLSFFGVQFYLPNVSVTELSGARLLAAALGVFVAVVEEVAMRGVVMQELQRLRVATWLQVLLSGLCFALYHSLHNPATLISGTLLGVGLAGVYVLGRRSLTPPLIAHGLINALGEPYLLMLAIAAT